MDTYNPALFLDIKLALQELILKKLPTFDFSKGAKFLTYIHEFITDAFTAFRMREECWTIKSLDIYKGIRRIAAIYNANAQDEQKTIKLFCEATGCTRQTSEIKIRKLAEWDTTNSHLYAKKAICFIALSKGVPEKKRIVFTRE